MTVGLLGIDAAWTAEQPSGVALLVADDSESWRCVALAPSYDSFLSLADGQRIDWAERPSGGLPEPERLVAAAAKLAGASVDVVAFDMPLSMAPITERRRADNAISIAFGSRGASTHTPSRARPGRISDDTRVQFGDLGYPLATAQADLGQTPSLMEVYPHVSLLALVGAPFRLPYKVAKSLKYWPGTSLDDRIERLLGEFATILGILRQHIQDIPLALPTPSEISSLSALKRYEDAIDALVCAWTATRFYQSQATPYGDDSAAIWVPSGTADSLPTHPITRPTRRAVPRRPRAALGAPVGKRCPIPGCTRVFRSGRSGWDGHVGSQPVHPRWRQELENGNARKQAFRDEFARWFD